jgi:hypothetical protein
MLKVASEAASLTLGNIGRDGHCGSSQLVRQSKPLVDGEALGELIDINYEIHCPLPGNQLFVVGNRHDDTPINSELSTIN